MVANNSFQFSKRDFFIVVLFILFFPIKTQFYNATYVLFDALITDGQISEVFTYNYLGYLLGCFEIQQLQESLGSKFDDFNLIVNISLFIVAVVSWYMLKNRTSTKKNFNLVDWVLLALFSFSLVDSLEFLLEFFNNISVYIIDIKKQVFRILVNTSILFLAGYLFFKCFNVTIKKNILYIVFPASIISFVVWFFYLGPMILPIVTK
ncbi:hypothetical protein [Corallibacter sp.]|uniref:hypothetical protein n=1 Tax=Corallibacter sp. TaxID=2038084 RepID=UPI003AB2FBC7